MRRSPRGARRRMFVARRRRSRLRPALLAAAVIASAAVASSGIAGSATTSRPGGSDGDEGTSAASADAGATSEDGSSGRAQRGSGDAGTTVTAGAASDGPGTDPAPTVPLLARAGALDLYLPHVSPIVVGYHEAAVAGGMDMTPVGVVRDDRNTTRTDLPPDDPAGRPYLVLTSRGRAAGPTSAVDVVLREGDEVLAPVTGTVVDVREYLLYGAHEDLRIEIVPDRLPGYRLVMIHLDGGEVEVGDRVVGGVTPVAATARLFPFGSHIDRETEPDRYPHVHIELQPLDRARPGDEVEDDAAEDDAGPASTADAAEGTPTS